MIFSAILVINHWQVSGSISRIKYKGSYITFSGNFIAITSWLVFYCFNVNYVHLYIICESLYGRP